MTSLIPRFPSFTKLTLELKPELERFTQQVPAYSDFSFASMWSWNRLNQLKVSQLNGNLVVIMPEYVSSQPVCSFIGNRQPLATVATLLDYLQERGEAPRLQRLPEHNFDPKVLETLKAEYQIEEDRDNFDYILAVSEIADLRGSGLHQKRKKFHKFINSYTFDHYIDDANHPKAQRNLLKLFKELSGDTPIDRHSAKELTAIRKILHLADTSKVKALSVYIDGELKGFSLFEFAHDGYVYGHFQKASTGFVGIFEFMNRTICQYLAEQGYQFYNIEQDLGIEGLRRAKLDYQPTFLRKFTISRRDQPNSSKDNAG